MKTGKIKIIELKNASTEWIKKKNNSKKLIIFSIIGLLTSYQLKEIKRNLEATWFALSKNKIKIPNSYYCVDIFGIEVSYNFIVVVLLITLGIGIYSAFFRNED